MWLQIRERESVWLLLILSIVKNITTLITKQINNNIATRTGSIVYYLFSIFVVVKILINNQIEALKFMINCIDLFER